MIGITPAHQRDLQNGNLPEGLPQRLRDKINFRISQEGEVIVLFHPTSYCVYAVVVDPELFSDKEMEAFRSVPHAVIKSQK